MPGPLENVEDAYPLTPVQEGMLFHSISSPDSGVYLEQFTCLISGRLDPNRLRAAWDEVYARHPALRTVFLWENLDAPLQVVRQKVELPWQIEDWRTLPPEQLEEKLASWRARDRERGFDLSSAPLARIFLARLASGDWQFGWTFYHGNVDGWSLGLILDQVLHHYEGSEHHRASPPPFAEYSRWMTAQDDDDAGTHWRELLRGYKEPVFPEIRTGPFSPSSPPARWRGHLDGRLWTGVQEFARAARLTPNSIIHGAWALLLRHYTGRDDLVFGSTVSGRPAALRQVESMVGCFLNTLPVRTRIDPGASLQSWLADLQNQHLALRDHEYSDLAAIQRRSELPAGTPLFETIVVFENLADLPVTAGQASIRLSEIELHEQSNFALALQAIPHPDTLELIFNFDPERFAQSAVDSLAESFLAIVAAMAAHPDGTLRDVLVLSDGQRDLIREWSRGPTLQEPPLHALELFERQVTEHPHAPALRYRDTALDYETLDRRTSELAAHLAAQGVTPGSVVGLCIERSPEMVIGIWGILKAGAAYLPIDPSYPVARLQQMLGDSGAKTLVSRSGLLPDLSCQRRVDFESLPVTATPTGPARSSSNGSEFAYVIFTSGSTGRPKGVGVTHDNLAYSLAARRQHYRRAPGSFLLLSSFSFDSSIVGLFWTLCSGGTLVLPAEKEEQDLDVLGELIKNHQVTHTLCLPALYSLLLAHVPVGKLHSLRVAIMAGEACPARLCNEHQSLLPSCELHNEYGPTEATVWCAAWKAPGREVSHVPIGRPIPGAHLHVLDPRGEPVPPGVAGELFVGGPGLTPGYLLEDKSERFLASPLGGSGRLYRTGDQACWLPDGNLLFLGRGDRQIKVRGHRIELGEIEAALGDHPAVEEAIAIGPPEIRADPASLLSALGSLDPNQARQLLAEAST